MEYPQFGKNKPLERQAAFVGFRLSEAAVAVYSDTATEPALIRLTEGYLRGRLGLPRT